MESERPQLSITLPRNFMFHYKDGQPPRTPEPEPQPDDLQPPPPPRQTLKVRRRRTTFTFNHEINEFGDSVSDMPVPTIEAPQLHSEASTDLPTMQTPQDSAYLSPGLSFNRMISPPKTPVAQMRTISNFEDPQHWADIYQPSPCSSSRPTSSSGFSDSSISSRGSYDSFQSLGGSCTSPEEEMTDPFAFWSPEVKQGPLSSPLAAHQPRAPKKLKLRATFTEEMDHHLWMTYMKYLQDPTVTPFKALPSTVPPNGVCHRVARMARKTWRAPRSGAAAVRAASKFNSRCGTPDTIKPAKSGSSTPVPGNRLTSRYPTEKQCRKRLRDLAKQKPTLSAHYQRLLHHRSPSPFQSSPPREPPAQKPLSSPFLQEPSTFSTRDMNVSLATSTAASMQFGNPLSQLATDVTPRIADNNNWSNMRASAHQKSQSLHIGLGLGLGNVVGSSFQAMSQMTDESMNQHNNNTTTARTWHAPSANPPRLGSPLQLHAPRPMSRVFKRRALHNFEEQARSRGSSFVNEVFGAPAESSHRRVRSRGFSLGDMMEGARRLPLSSSSPAETYSFPNMGAAMQYSSIQSAEAQGQATIRLGSPFSGRPNNTFPRASTSHGFEPPASFEQRFAALPSDPAQLSRS